jgi:hypothetical protein
LNEQPKPTSTLTLLRGRDAMNAESLFAMYTRLTGRAVTDVERERCFAIIAQNRHKPRT